MDEILELINNIKNEDLLDELLKLLKNIDKYNPEDQVQIIKKITLKLNEVNSKNGEK